MSRSKVEMRKTWMDGLKEDRGKSCGTEIHHKPKKRMHHKLVTHQPSQKVSKSTESLLIASSRCRKKHLGTFQGQFIV